jgi:uncharacterized protein (DUF1499 family)
MIDFATLTLPASPNTYLVAPADLCANAKPNEVAPIYAQPAEIVQEAFSKQALAEKRVVKLTTDPSALQQEFVQRTALMGFPDTVTVRFIPLSDTTSTIAIYSRSKVGYSDMGVNGKRVQRWMAATAAALSAR